MIDGGVINYKKKYFKYVQKNKKLRSKYEIKIGGDSDTNDSKLDDRGHDKSKILMYKTYVTQHKLDISKEEYFDIFDNGIKIGLYYDDTPKDFINTCNQIEKKNKLFE